MMDLCNSFLTRKLNAINAVELTERTYRDYRAKTDRLIVRFGKDRRVDDLRPVALTADPAMKAMLLLGNQTGLPQVMDMLRLGEGR